jgi:hypothetical protein
MCNWSAISRPVDPSATSRTISHSRSVSVPGG